MYYLDYSEPHPSIKSIVDGGYGGVIRYVTSPSLMQPPNKGNPKHITQEEYDKLVEAKRDIWLVYQGTTTDADGGFNRGRENALRAEEGCQKTLRMHNSPIFFTNDRPELPNPTAWRGYLDGAASVLGIERVGAYGFKNAMDAAVGHASWFWQSGRRSDVRDFVHIWQDNNWQGKVGNVSVDRNLILRPLPFFPLSDHEDPTPAPEPVILDMQLDDIISTTSDGPIRVRDVLLQGYKNDNVGDIKRFIIDISKEYFAELTGLMLTINGQPSWGDLETWDTLSSKMWARL